MKRNLILVMAAVAMLASCNNKGYVIEGTFVNTDDSVSVERKAYLFSEFSNVTDTADIIDGKFTFKGQIEQPVPYFIGIEGMQGEAELFLENGKYTAEIEQSGSYMSHSLVNGGNTQSVFYNIAKTHSDVMDKHGIDIEAIMQEMYSPDITEERIDELQDMMNKAFAESDSLQNIIIEAYEAENPLSYYALTRLYYDMGTMSLEDIAEELQPYTENGTFASSPLVKKISEYLTANSHLMKGQQAPDFTVPDMEGNDVTFSSIYPKHKVTMIDFWASWCGPCRNFNPVLVEIYNEYHDKGFEIVGVSMDNDKESWLQAIKDDGLTWIQLSDLAYWNTKPRELYNVSYIPQNVLVDSEGKIIATKLDEAGLEEVLDEYLGE